MTETDWSPDHRTLHDFMEQMGEEGVRFINEYAVEWAVEEKLADPQVLVVDTTAQEAAIPHPNEMGLMAAFMTTVAAASTEAGSELKEFAAEAAPQFEAAKKTAREYRLFAKTREVKEKVMAEMANFVEQVNKRLAGVVTAAEAKRARPSKYAKVATDKVLQLHETTTKLLPQIRYWLKTGFVASGKIISLHLPELYSIVRGKVGKTVEFGLSWGIRRRRGGYLMATLAAAKNHLVDSRFAVSAVKEHIQLFGKPPKAYAYDRGGWSAKNVLEMKKLGVKEVGLAPRGKAEWQVSAATKPRRSWSASEPRSRVESEQSNTRSTGSSCQLHSIKMMGFCGQSAVMGFDLDKLVRELAKREKRQPFALRQLPNEDPHLWGDLNHRRVPRRAATTATTSTGCLAANRRSAAFRTSDPADPGGIGRYAGSMGRWAHLYRIAQRRAADRDFGRHCIRVAVCIPNCLVEFAATTGRQT